MTARRSLLFVYVAVEIGSVAASCPSPVTRPGPTFDGSAYWAWGIAQPLVGGFAPDAQLYGILGAVILTDGRLPANTGEWSFVTWSPSQHQVFQVTVSADGHASTSTTSQAAPGLNGQPVPAGWANSTVVFQATTGKRSSNATQATLAALNIASYPSAPGQAVWAIRFDGGGPNQLVRWDGTYIGPQ